MRTSPKRRPSADAATHTANASRETAARLDTSGGASDNGLLPRGLAGAGSNEISHRGVRADRGAVEDGFVPEQRNLAGQAEVLGYRLARVPALGYEDGDQDHVPGGDALDDGPDLGFLIQEPHLDEVVEPALPYAPGVHVDDAPGVLV